MIEGEDNTARNWVTVLIVFAFIMLLQYGGFTDQWFGVADPTPTSEVTNHDFFGLNSVVTHGETVRVSYWNNSDELCPGIYSEDGVYLTGALCPATGNTIGFETSIESFAEIEIGMGVKLCDLNENCSETIVVSATSFTRECWGDFAVTIDFEGGKIVDTTCIEDGYSLSFTTDVGEQFNVTVTRNFEEFAFTTVGTTERSGVFCTDEGSSAAWLCYSGPYSFEVEVTPSQGG